MSRAGYLFTWDGPEGSLVVRDAGDGVSIEVSDRNRRTSTTPIPTAWLVELALAVLRKAVNAGPNEPIEFDVRRPELLPAVDYVVVGQTEAVSVCHPERLAQGV